MDSKMKTFALDFDDTLTACPDLWRIFLNTCEVQGHKVYLVTARRDTDENREIIREFFEDHDLPRLPLVFACLGSKIHACESRGIKIDIWIDDNPTVLVNGH